MLKAVVGESTGTLRPQEPTSTNGNTAPTGAAPNAQHENGTASVCPALSGDSTVSILITDSIFSYSNDAVRQDPEINKENIAGLASEVQDIFNDAASEGKVTSILAFKSHFHGTYYDYRNHPREWGSELRPYYLWLVGSPGNVRAVTVLLASEGVTPSHMLEFGQGQVKLSPAVLQYTLNKGRWFRHKDENPIRILVKHSDTGGQSQTRRGDDINGLIQLTVGINLSSLSPDLQQMEFLEDHFRVTPSRDLTVKEFEILPRALVEPKIENRDDQKDTLNSTHFVLITTDFKFEHKASVALSLDNALPDWPASWSNMDDTKNDERTFGFVYFVQAIQQAYYQNQPLAETRILLDR